MLVYNSVNPAARPYPLARQGTAFIAVVAIRGPKAGYHRNPRPPHYIPAGFRAAMYFTQDEDHTA